MNLQSICIANGASIVLLLVLLCTAGREHRRRLLDEKLFFTMVIMTMLQSIVETVTFFIDGVALPGFRALALALNSFLYVNNIFFAFTWTVYADFKLFEDTERIRRIYRFVSIPALLVVAGVAVNFFTPVFFRVTAENVYQRTGLFVCRMCSPICIWSMAFW